MSYTIRLHKNHRHDRRTYESCNDGPDILRWQWEVGHPNVTIREYGTTHTRRGAIRQAKRFIRQDKATPCPWTTYKGKVS